MALKVPNVGEAEILSRALTYEGSKLKLFTNNYTCTETSVIGDFTEMGVAGYAQKTLATGSWSISSTATYAEQEFLPTTAVSAYGYVVTNSAGSVVLWAETFTAAPFVIPAGGGSIKVTLNITAD
jgi:hypothetical protein